MRVALDTNILVYAEDVNSPAQGEAARDLVARIPNGAAVVALQGLGELFNVLTRKAARPSVDAKRSLAAWQRVVTTVPTNAAVLEAAVELSVASGLRIWDAVHLAAAASADCEVFLSEDLQDGFRWRGVEVVNPFLPQRRKWLQDRLRTET